MFKFLKEKLSFFFRKKSKEIEKRTEKEEKTEIEKAKEQPSIIKKIKEKFSKTKISDAEFEDFWNELKTILLQNNIALAVVEEIKNKTKKELIGKEIKRKEIEKEMKAVLRKVIEEIISVPVFDLVEKIREETRKQEPYVIVFFGINGGGKTTTIAKIANMLKKNGISCVLAASDTFRAASIEQLEKHASVLKVKLIKHQYGADAAAVAYDAISHAKASSIKVVLVDTAGRMHTQANLLAEMQKICRVTKPNLRIFVGEAIAGNDVIEQAKTFDEKVGIDCIILTKADVDEKGGACISATFVTKKPIIFLGTGQNYDDIEKFDKEKMLKSLGL